VHAQCAKRTLLSDRVQPWQVDLIASLGPDDCELSPESRVHRWISAQSKAEPVVSATGPPPRSVHGLGRSSLGDKYDLRSELNLHFNDFCPRDFGDSATRSSTVFSSIEVLGDRYYSPAVYTPLRVPDWLSISWPDQSMCQEIRRTYLLPTLLHLPIERIDRAHAQGSYQHLNLRRQRLVVDPVGHHSYSREFNLGQKELEILKRFVMENTIEHAMRKLDDRVLDLTQLSEGAETILLRATPAIIAASNDANKHLRKYNESEIKQQWQSILRAVVNACPVVEGRYLDA
ncbi:hypothetical protein FB107DRAFT_252892, partial [Schizophyllum commune]